LGTIAVTGGLIAAVILGPGALAPADSGVLEQVQSTRLRYGFGLTEPAPDGALLLGVEDCALLGWRGVALVEHSPPRVVRVVDCQQAEHEPLSRRGLLADVNEGTLGHRKAQVWLWPQ
jgi:hypothetical protein